MCAISSGLMPMPVSRTVNSNPFVTSVLISTRPPGSVNFTALERTFSNIWRTRTRSQQRPAKAAAQGCQPRLPVASFACGAIQVLRVEAEGRQDGLKLIGRERRQHELRF